MAYGTKVTPRRPGPAPRRAIGQRLGRRRVQGIPSVDEPDNAITRSMTPRSPRWDDPMGNIVKSV